MSDPTCKDRFDICWSQTPSRKQLWEQVSEVPAHLWTKAFENSALVLAVMLSSGYAGVTWIEYEELFQCDKDKEYWYVFFAPPNKNIASKLRASCCIVMQFGLSAVARNLPGKKT